jgi:hypothetical protein
MTTRCNHETFDEDCKAIFHNKHFEGNMTTKCSHETFDEDCEEIFHNKHFEGNMTPSAVMRPSMRIVKKFSTTNILKVT